MLFKRTGGRVCSLKSNTNLRRGRRIVVVTSAALIRSATRETMSCERSDDGRAEHCSPSAQRLRTRSATAESGGGGGSGADCGGCSVRARLQADRSALLHGLCATAIAAAAARVMLVATITAYLVGVCGLSPVLGTLSRGLFRFLGLCGRRSTEASAIGRGCPRNGGRSVPRPVPSTSGGEALPSVIKRGMQLLMRRLQRPFVRPKRSGRPSRHREQRHEDHRGGDGLDGSYDVHCSER